MGFLWGDVWCKYLEVLVVGWRVLEIWILFLIFDVGLIIFGWDMKVFLGLELLFFIMSGILSFIVNIWEV